MDKVKLWRERVMQATTNIERLCASRLKTSYETGKRIDGVERRPVTE